MGYDIPEPENDSGTTGQIDTSLWNNRNRDGKFPVKIKAAGQGEKLGDSKCKLVYKKFTICYNWAIGVVKNSVTTW